MSLLDCFGETISVAGVLEKERNEGIAAFQAVSFAFPRNLSHSHNKTALYSRQIRLVGDCRKAMFERQTLQI